MAHDEPAGEQGTPSGCYRAAFLRPAWLPITTGQRRHTLRVEREYRDELPISDVHGHPHNVREDLGDLTELVKSIREIGILERAFKRLTESVAKQQAADARERRSIVQAVEDLTDVFTDDTTVQPTAANG